MEKKLKWFASSLLLFASVIPSRAFDTNTYTNVLQNITFTLSVFEQGATNKAGTAVKSEVRQLNTAWFLKELAALNPGVNFAHAKLVEATGYFTNNTYTLTVLSSNLLGTNFVNTSSNYIYNTPSNYTASAQALSNFVYLIYGDTNTLDYTTQSNALPYGDNATFTNNSWISAISGPTQSIVNGGPIFGILVGSRFTPLTNYFSDTNWSKTLPFVSFSDSSALGGFGVSVPDIEIGPGTDLDSTNGRFISGSISEKIGEGTAFLVSTNSTNSTFMNFNLRILGWLKETQVADTLHTSSKVSNHSIAWNVIGTAALGGNIANTTNQSLATNGINSYFVGGFNTAYGTNGQPTATTYYYVTNYVPALIKGSVSLEPISNRPAGGLLPESPKGITSPPYEF